jgi:protein disulfide-isomerase
MANSFNARLLHLAKKYNKSNELEELFKAYLTDGKTSMISLR